MKFSPVLLLATLFLAGTLPSWGDSFMPNGPCHDMDMYGIYKVCGTPDERHHEEPLQTIVQPVYVTIPQPLVAPAPVSEFEPTPVTTDNESPHRELTAVDAKLHDLHLLLVDKQAHGEIGTSFFDEETRYLAQIEQHEQSSANANGGYLTIAQENSLLQQLRDVENEINRTIS
jgi:hypothetical protein